MRPATLIALLRDTIAADRFPLSPRIQRLWAILAKFKPLPAPVAVYGSKTGQRPLHWGSIARAHRPLQSLVYAIRRPTARNIGRLVALIWVNAPKGNSLFTGKSTGMALL